MPSKEAVPANASRRCPMAPRRCPMAPVAALCTNIYSLKRLLATSKPRPTNLRLAPFAVLHREKIIELDARKMRSNLKRRAYLLFAILYKCESGDLNPDPFRDWILSVENSHLFYNGLTGHLGGNPLSINEKRQIGIGVAWHLDGLWMSPNVSDLCQVTR